MATYHGDTTLTTILPAAIFGPLRSADNAGSVDIIARLLTGRPPVVPRFGFSIIDVRDLVDLHIRAVTSPSAAGERFIGAGDFMWLSEIAQTLRSRLGQHAPRCRPVVCQMSSCGRSPGSSPRCARSLRCWDAS